MTTAKSTSKAQVEKVEKEDEVKYPHVISAEKASDIKVKYQVAIESDFSIDGFLKVDSTFVRRLQAVNSQSSPQTMEKRGMNFLNSLLTEDNIVSVEDYYAESDNDVPEDFWEKIITVFLEDVLPKVTGE